LIRKVNGDYRISAQDGKVTLLTDTGEPLSDDLCQDVLDALYWKYSEQTWLYIGKSQTAEETKVGISADLDRRAKELGIDLLVSVMFPTRRSASEVELWLHSWIKDRRIHNEWYKLSKVDLYFITRILRPFHLRFHYDKDIGAELDLSNFNILIPYTNMANMKIPCGKCGIQCWIMELWQFERSRSGAGNGRAAYKCPNCGLIEGFEVSMPPDRSKPPFR
jgi:hypothetical protein